MRKKYYSSVVLLLIFIVIVFFYKIVFTNLTYFQRDIILQFKPWKIFINNTLAQIKNPNSTYLDFLPLWNHYNHCGAPLMANLQSQVFYPFSIIFYLISDFTTAYKIFILLHFFLSMLFMFLLLKKKNFSFIPALIGSIIWGLNGFMVSRVEFLSVFATIIWLPLAVAIFDSITNMLDFTKIIMLGFILAVQFLAGHAQMWSYTLVFLICYSIFCSYKLKTFIPLVSFICSVIISISISAIQFLPTIEFLLYSTRVGENTNIFGMPYEKAVVGSLKLSDLINFFYPFNWQFRFFQPLNNTKVITLSHYWLYTFYIGFFGSLLTILGFLNLTKTKQEKFFYITICLLAILYAFGENFLVYRIVYKYIPPTRVFRHPSVSIYIVVFIFCIFAAEGLQRIQLFLKKSKYKKFFLALVVLICYLELFFYKEKISMLLPKSILDEKGELINFLLSETKKDELPYRFAHTPLTQKLAATTSGKTFYGSIAKYRDRIFGNINLEYNLYNFRGQDIELTNYYKFMDFTYNRKSLDDAIPLFSIANVKYILSSLQQKTSFSKLIKNGEIKVYENPYVLPLLYPVNNLIFEQDINKSLDLLDKLKFKMLNTAIVHSKENLILNLQQPKNINFVIHSLEIKPNKIFAILTVSTPTFLVISQNYYPGWHCKVNNNKTKIYHCNIFMKGIYLTEGTHKIYIYYDPQTFKIGCVITLASLILCFLYLLEKTEWFSKTNLK